jgi:hypothetical protein
MQDAVGVVAGRSCLRRRSHEAIWERAPTNHRIQLCKSKIPIATPTVILVREYALFLYFTRVLASSLNRMLLSFYSV